MSWLVVVGTALFVLVILFEILYVAPFGFWDQLMRTHLPSILGLPLAAIASLVLVIILRTVSGAIEIKLFGLELRGAAGPLLMWVLCFLAMTLAIVKTWDLGASVPVAVEPARMTQPPSK